MFNQVRVPYYIYIGHIFRDGSRFKHEKKTNVYEMVMRVLIGLYTCYHIAQSQFAVASQRCCSH